jgi:hypothetical protein
VWNKSLSSCHAKSAAAPSGQITTNTMKYQQLWVD